MPDLIPDVLAAVLTELEARQGFPESTYRLQFHAGFTFRAALEIVPYLHALGVTHCYASPFLQARPGSTHGYDITNHQAINPEIGTEADYEALCQALQTHGMGQILDIVPNHMGVTANSNAWWRDVLENGPASPYAGFFDIAWYASPRVEMHNKVLLPILGKSYGEALESQEIRLEYNAGAFTLNYFDHSLPLAPYSYAMLLEGCRDGLSTLLGEDAEVLMEYDSILTAIRNLPPRHETDPARMAERQREKEVIKRRLAALTETHPQVHACIEQNVASCNGTPGDARSFDRLDALLQEQVYRLCYWRVASEEINYRRFFDINELAALSMEKPEVFVATHGLILRLLGEGKVHGVRLDHPDGLYDPLQYLERLQQHYVLSVARRLLPTDSPLPAEATSELEALREVGMAQATPNTAALLHRPLYVVGEKILGVREALREDWPIYGTSGYDFLNLLNGLFVAVDNRPALSRIYRDWTQDWRAFADVVYDAKRLIMQVSLANEVHMLAYQLDRLAQQHRRSRDFTFNSLRYALQEVIACFPVYRSYITDRLHLDDRLYVQQAVARARRKNPALSRELFDFVRDMLLLNYLPSASEAEQAEQRRFVGKFQQVTAPVMAKGLEDTAFYIFNRLLSLNEVGNDAERFGVPPEELHHAFQERQSKWPWAMSALSTHDTKRSEDVRARLNVLSELPEEWQACLQRWSALNAPYRQEVDEGPVPGANEEYLLYQTLLGAWPLEPYTTADYAAFVERIQAYMQKALHEAKVHTSWINPNPAYDEAIQHFVARILDAETNAGFVDDLRTFHQRLSHYGLFNALSQTLLKITAPGVPDTYQGTELWDFSLVDPDNRRPVDYTHRQRLLQELQARMAGENRVTLVQELLTSRVDGRIKLYVTALALACRRRHPGLFATGDYLPAQAIGSRRQHVFGFVRCQHDRSALVVVPRLVAGLLQDQHAAPLGEAVWHDTRLQLPGANPHQTWHNVFTGASVTLAEADGSPTVAVAELLTHFPVALCITS